ncbi:IS4 family transposase [Bacillus thuringiensis]|uniref:IS4 family transposase n=1 Tax=Bacillus thuringiensis TaxID=1428 RepID=UPI002D7E4C5E|nr:IS4 family transposase [Bacillus thuringiensis]MEB4815449.1 IS4 family transposase [Bacillus thuringiensis]
MNMHQKQELSLFAEELYRYMSLATLNQLAIKAGGMKRKRKCHGHHFLSLCVWLNQQIPTTSLTQLCSQLETSTGILLSPEGLNRRFNSDSVTFFRTVFTTLLQAKIGGVSKISHSLSSYFERILVLDSTTFQVPDRFATTYPGAGGCSHTAGVKIQLEYNLLSGKFSDVEIEPRKRSNQAYSATRTGMAQKNELYIRDLGYFPLVDLDQMDQRGTYYISRLKLNTNVYVKNPSPEYFKNGSLKKQSEYIQIDVQQILKQLQPGETFELKHAYIGDKQQLFARVIFNRLTDKQLQKQRARIAEKEKSKNRTYLEKSKIIARLNVYVTNIPWEWVPMEQVHELYTLRWQIEIVFKTWKSLFKIDHYRNVKQERLECQLYGKLIAIFLCSSTMFKMRQLLLQKKKKELSEYKAIGMIQDHLSLLYQAIQRNTHEITKVLIRLFHLLQKNGRKSHRYEKKTVFDIMGVVYEYNGLKKQKKVA